MVLIRLRVAILNGMTGPVLESLTSPLRVESFISLIARFFKCFLSLRVIS